MSEPAKFAAISIALSVISSLVYAVAVTGATYQKFTLATVIFSLMGLISLTLSIVALVRSPQQEASQRTRKIARFSLAVAIGVMLVIGILLLNIWVFNFRTS
jgi:hypothetical protein